MGPGRVKTAPPNRPDRCRTYAGPGPRGSGAREVTLSRRSYQRWRSVFSALLVGLGGRRDGGTDGGEHLLEVLAALVPLRPARPGRPRTAGAFPLREGEAGLRRMSARLVDLAGLEAESERRCSSSPKLTLIRSLSMVISPEVCEVRDEEAGNSCRISRGGRRWDHLLRLLLLLLHVDRRGAGDLLGDVLQRLSELVASSSNRVISLWNASRHRSSALTRRRSLHLGSFRMPRPVFVGADDVLASRRELGSSPVETSHWEIPPWSMCFRRTLGSYASYDADPCHAGSTLSRLLAK